MSFAAIDREIAYLRRRVDTLMRKFARELAIIQARRVAEPIANQWNTAEPPDPSTNIAKPLAQICPPTAQSSTKPLEIAL